MSPPPPAGPRRAVQLAPSSLALVLRRLQRERRREDLAATAAPPECDEEASGAAVFQAFRRANAACYWNAGLARAVARVWLQGWLRGGVLLLQGPAAPLQLLRDAWLRRALRPPEGFLIRAVGDVSPVHINPISQSQFVPLGEVLCCAISDMNEAHITVTQETLLDHLGKHYPGIATPTHDILYSTLGILIKEWKIYHTGEGYFIVTPNTYFISNNAMKNNRRALLQENCPMEPSITYLVSMEDSTEVIRDNFPVTSHCKSCHCFPEQTVANEQRPQQLGSNEQNGKSQKESCESRLSVHNPTTDSITGNRSCETAHSTHTMKEKEKVKKFGLSLFWRHTSKKENPKKAHSSFSAQFPPEEWPVRDEDNLDNIPRDVEHEIIKRINPVLTVDNLNKHTVLMQKIEEEKKYINKGTSTEVLTMKHRHLSKGGTRKKQIKATKHHRKMQPSKEKEISKTDREFKTDELALINDKLENCVEHSVSCIINEAITCDKLLCEDTINAESHFIYKKEIDNPFQHIPHRGNKSAKGHKSQKNGNVKYKAPRSERNFPRSQSLDSSRTMNCKAKQALSVKCDDEDEKKQQLATDFASHYHHHHVQDHCAKYTDYLQYQTDGEFRCLRDSVAWKHNLHRGTSQNHRVETHIVSNNDVLIEEGSTERKCRQSFNQSHPCDQAATYGLPGQNSDYLKNADLSRDTDTVQQLKQSEKIVGHRGGDCLESELKSNTSKWLESLNPQYKGFTYDEQTLYQKVDHGDACSSLYHDDEQQELMELPKFQSIQLPYSSSEPRNLNNSEQQDLGTDASASRSVHSHTRGFRTDSDKFDSCEHEGNECPNLSRSKDSLKEYHKLNLEGESCVCHQVSQYAYKNNERADTAECGQISDVSKTCVFDLCDMHGTETRTWQKSLNEAGEKLASLTLSPKGREIKTNLVGKPQDVAVLKQNIPHEQNHLEEMGNHSITGDSGIDSPRTQSLASANSAILDGLKKRRSFLMNLEGIEKTIQSGKTLTRNSLLQLTPVMNV
ncbi:storkhead-box protein 1 [Tiliqua scincoides]|uniref:storkhead-box protein 1 n=1 Tax=Tiliqua scincoides TaxID=71010 RepID=UPI00346336E6